MGSDMQRRDFITLLGSVAAAWPLPVQAQGPSHLRRIGAMMPEAENTIESQARKAAFEQALSELGWKSGQTIAIDYRWSISNLERARAATTELLRLNPHLILAVATPAAKAAQEATRTLPIVFIGVSEPVAQGIVNSLARPGGNITGFTNLEPTFGEKLIELLKEVAPTVNHAGIIFNPDTAPYAPSFARSAEVASPKMLVKIDTLIVRTPAEIENAILKIASEPGGGLVFPPDTYTGNNSKLIVESATRHYLPAIYSLKYFTTDGGLAFYGIDVAQLFRQAAGYVDRIMKGEKPAELPAQQPTKYELVINLKAARAIGLTVPPTLLSRADEVIE